MLTTLIDIVTTSSLYDVDGPIPNHLQPSPPVLTLLSYDTIDASSNIPAKSIGLKLDGSFASSLADLINCRSFNRLSSPTLSTTLNHCPSPISCKALINIPSPPCVTAVEKLATPVCCFF